MLNYLFTKTIAAFKDEAGSDSLEIKRNNRTNKLFFACGDLTGAVSTKAAMADFEDVVISKVSSDDTGDVFYLIHQRGEGGATRLATL